jgi:hypothetical protein
MPCRLKMGQAVIIIYLPHIATYKVALLTLADGNN